MRESWFVDRDRLTGGGVGVGGEGGRGTVRTGRISDRLDRVDLRHCDGAMVGAAAEIGCNQHETIVRRMRLILCNSARGFCRVF